MNSGSSASISAAGHSAGADWTSSWYQRSRPSFHCTGSPPRRTTTMRLTLAAPSQARSALSFNGTCARRASPDRP